LLALTIVEARSSMTEMIPGSSSPASIGSAPREVSCDRDDSETRLASGGSQPPLTDERTDIGVLTCPDPSPTWFAATEVSVDSYLLSELVASSRSPSMRKDGPTT
jgi:hypothetical protein